MLRSSWNRIGESPRQCFANETRKPNANKRDQLSSAAMLHSSNRHVAAPRAFKRALVLIWIWGSTRESHICADALGAPRVEDALGSDFNLRIERCFVDDG